MKKLCFGPKFKFLPFSVAEKSYFGAEIKFLPTSVDEKAIFGFKFVPIGADEKSYVCPCLHTKWSIVGLHYGHSPMYKVDLPTSVILQ